MERRNLQIRYLVWDIVSSLLVWTSFMIFRKIIIDARLFSDAHILVPNYNSLPGFLFFPLMCIFIFFLSGFYVKPDKHSKSSLFFNTLLTTVIISITIFFILLLDDLVVSYQYYYYSLLVLILMLSGITGMIRLSIFFQFRHALETNKISTNTIIIGTGSNALKMGREIEKNARDYTLKGYVSIEKSAMEVPKEQIAGYYNKIGEIIQKNNIKDVIISLDNPDEYQLFRIINNLYQYDVEIRFTPRLYEILTGGSRIKMVGINPLVNITTLNMTDWEFSVKRFIDVIVSAVALAILSPLFLFFAIRIKADSPGSVFYYQERIGYQGKPFKIIKFRTMYRNSESTGVPLLSSAFDSRITPVGRILRKYRIDEIPQFINILKGEMSIVGPRPERKFYIDQIIESAPYYCLLYKVRPGLTSWGPIKIGYSDSIDKMIERLNYDIIYLDNMSLINDFKILFQTFEIVFKGKGI